MLLISRASPWRSTQRLSKFMASLSAIAVANQHQLEQCRPGSTLTECTPAVDSTMLGELYNKHSVGQLDAHNITHSALRGALGRVAQLTDGSALSICDLGCASGANAMVVARMVADGLKQTFSGNVQYALNDLLENDWSAVAKEWSAAGLPSTFHPVFIPRSFYTALFPTASVHLSLSYITLHWLPAPPCDLGPGAVYCKEPSVPEQVQATWQMDAHKTLVGFLRLRANELVDHGEGIYLMVSWGLWTDMGEGRPSLFQSAIDRAVSAGSVEPAAAAKALINYYLRTPDEVTAAASEVSELETLDVASHTIMLGGGLGPERLAGLGWAIHCKTLQTSMGVSDDVMKNIEGHFLDICTEEFGSRGVPIDYVFVHVRRKARP